MLVVDDKTMVLGGVAILLALLSPIVNALILKLKVGKSDIDGSSLPVNDVSLPGISVVMTVDDEGEDLKKNLPQWLDQSYGGKYQVIVVVPLYEQEEACRDHWREGSQIRLGALDGCGLLSGESHIP